MLFINSLPYHCSEWKRCSRHKNSKARISYTSCVALRAELYTLVFIGIPINWGS